MTLKDLKNFRPSTVIERTWEGIPGYILCFPVAISMSGNMATEREQTMALTAQERTERLLDFRMRTVADVISDTPTMIPLAGIDKALHDKQAAAIEGITIDAKSPEYIAKVDRVQTKVRLTKEEVDALREPFPGFPDHTPETLNEVAYEYFSQMEDGRKVFQLLIEEVVSEYWQWATPRPTISVSAYMQGK